MTKLIVLLLLTVSILFTSCATPSSNSTVDSASFSVEQTEESVITIIPSSFFDDSDSDSVSSESAAKNYCNRILKENGVLDAILNEDGSVILTTTISKHNEMLETMKQVINNQISEYTSQSLDSGIIDVTYNDDMTSFIVAADANNFNGAMNFSSMFIGMCAEGYHAMNGNSTPHIDINYVDNTTGNLLDSITYPDDYDRMFAEAESTVNNN